MQLDLAEIPTAWAPLVGTIFVPLTEEEYRQIVSLLDRVIEVVGEGESHPLASLMEVLGLLIEHYETAHIPELSE